MRLNNEAFFWVMLCLIVFFMALGAVSESELFKVPEHYFKGPEYKHSDHKEHAGDNERYP